VHHHTVGIVAIQVKYFKRIRQLYEIVWKRIKLIVRKCKPVYFWQIEEQFIYFIEMIRLTAFDKIKNREAE
jgi:hypothetical protein